MDIDKDRELGIGAGLWCPDVERQALCILTWEMRLLPRRHAGVNLQQQWHCQPGTEATSLCGWFPAGIVVIAGSSPIQFISPLVGNICWRSSETQADMRLDRKSVGCGDQTWRLIHPEVLGIPSS